MTGQRFVYRNPRILQHAKGQPCTNCDREDGTTVAAHSNLAEHGKAKGMKAHDCFVAFLCFACHNWLDHGTKARDPSGLWQADRCDKREMFSRAMHKTFLLLLRDGVLR